MRFVSGRQTASTLFRHANSFTQDDGTATAILKKKKKDNQLM